MPKTNQKIFIEKFNSNKEFIFGGIRFVPMHIACPALWEQSVNAAAKNLADKIDKEILKCITTISKTKT